MPEHNPYGNMHSEALREAGLSFDDLQRMQVSEGGGGTSNGRKRHRRERGPAPDWVNNNAIVQQVLAIWICKRANIKPPAGLSPWEQIQRAQARLAQNEPMWLNMLLRYQHKFGALRQQPDTDPDKLRSLAVQIERLDTRVLIDRKAAAVAAGVIHYYFRMGYDSVAVATDIDGLKPTAARQIILQLKRAYAALMNPPAPKAKKVRAAKPAPAPRPAAPAHDAAWFARREYKTPLAIRLKNARWRRQRAVKAGGTPTPSLALTALTAACQ